MIQNPHQDTVRAACVLFVVLFCPLFVVVGFCLVFCPLSRFVVVFVAVPDVSLLR